MPYLARLQRFAKHCYRAVFAIERFQSAYAAQQGRFTEAGCTQKADAFDRLEV